MAASRLSVTLLSNASASGSAVEWPGGALNDAMAIWGGAAGFIGVTATRPQSVYGGMGSSFDGVTLYEATAPGGGGTFYGTGAGQPGRVQFIIVRGIVLDLMGNVF